MLNLFPIVRCIMGIQFTVYVSFCNGGKQQEFRIVLYFRCLDDEPKVFPDLRKGMIFHRGPENTNFRVKSIALIMFFGQQFLSVLKFRGRVRPIEPRESARGMFFP